VFWWADESQKWPDIQYFLVVGAGIEEGVQAVPGGNGCTVNLGQIRPRSRGEIKLRSGDPLDDPAVMPRYFSDPYDLEAITDGTLHAMQVMEQNLIAHFVRQRHVPQPGMTAREQIRQFCQTTAHAALHPAGTCRAGRDSLSVVDPELRVHGVQGLRVADASIMPTLISGNPNSVCIMIGEKLAD